MAALIMNMQQPDPAGLFDQFQKQKRNPPVNQSVVAQISQRPLLPDTIPPVSQSAPPQQLPVPDNSQQPVNPFVALYESGLMEQSIQQAHPQPQKNPFQQLYESGFMTQSILDYEDNKYEQDLKNWEKQKREFIPYRGMGRNAYPKEPEAPARDLEQISKDWQLGAKSLRGKELGNILHQIESGQINPEQDLLITQHLEPELPEDIKKQLQISRLTRDKFLELQKQAVTEEQEAKAFEKESLYMSPMQLASDPRFGTQSQRTNVFGRTIAKGATANYAFAPDKEKLNSEKPEEQAEERAKRLFYQKQESEYPVTSLAGNILGAIAPIGLTGVALRSARVAGATSNLRTSLLSANEINRAKNIIATRGAPKTVAGTLGESAATGFVYDIASRPEGSEEMNLKENLFARGQNVGFGMATGLGLDLGLMGIGKAWRKLQDLPGNVVNKVEVKRRKKLLGDFAKDNGYKNVDDMLDDIFLSKVTDETGERIRMQTEVMDMLPEFKGLIQRVSETKNTGKTEIPEITGAKATTETTVKTDKPPERLTTGEAETTFPRSEESPVTTTAKEVSSSGKETFAFPDRDTAVASLLLNKFSHFENKLYSFSDFEANEVPLINKLLEKLREKNVSTDKAVSKVRSWLHSQKIAIGIAQTNRLNKIIEEAYISGNPIKLYESVSKPKKLEVIEAPTQPKIRQGEIIESSPSSIEAEAPTQHKIRQGEIIEAPVNELKLSEDVPQFKEGANQKGVVEPLGGTFDRTGVGPIQIWVRNDGSKEVISGRHRLDLAQRSGEETIPAQYHYESKGFGKQQAAALDAILNIREGQGKVKDYVDFIKATGLTKAEADAQGILARATGRRAYTIADSGTDTLIAAHRANKLTDEAATRIAAAAPNNEALQAVGIKAIQEGKTITVAENMVKAVKTMTDESAMKPGGDMFGFDDSALKEAESLARKASAKQAEIQRTLSAVQGAAKNPELAAKEGVDVRDPEAVKRRIAELKQQKQDWQNWHTNPELTAQLRGEKPSIPPKAEQELSAGKEPPSKQEPKPPDQQEVFGLTTQTDAELSAKAKAASEAEAAQLKQQQDIEAKARADQEAKDFELGIQGSGKDVSAKQTDLLGTGKGEQPNRQPSVKSEPEAATKPLETKGEVPKKLSFNKDNGKVELDGKILTKGKKSDLRDAVKKGIANGELPGRIGDYKLDKPEGKRRWVAEYKPSEPKVKTTSETKQETITNNPDQNAKDLKGGPYTLNYHNAIHKALKEGKLSLDEYKAAFQKIIDNKDEILNRLNKYTKAKLMGISGKTYAYPRDVKKAEALEDAYNRLLKQYLFGRPTAKSGPIDIFKLAKNKADFEQSVKDVVAKTKQSDLDSWAKTAKEYNAAKTKANAEKKYRIKNPQTLEDYQLAIRENGKESLTKAQIAEYERLTTEADWQAREAQQQKKNIVKGMETEEALEIQPITEGTHTKTGDTIFNVKVETKLGKQKFQEAAQQARAMKGGYYKGNFWLKTREDAEQFIHWLNGQNIDRTPAKMAQETSQANKQVSKLHTMADKLEQQGTSELNAPRTTNTARQMDQASSARGKATKKINFAKTLRNIANGIEDGSVRFLSKLSNMTQLDTLNKIKRQSVPENMMDSSYNGYSMSRQLKEGVSLEDYIDKIEIPKVELHKDKARELVEQLKGKRGFAPLRKELEKQISIAIRSDKNTISMNPHSEYAGMLDNFVKKYDVDPGWLYKQNMEDIKRLQRMGITSDEHLRSAIRELETVKSSEGVKTTKERKLDDMRFKIKQAVKQFNDFFPTPEDIVNRVMELADIRPGMKTLEPNAGMGHIAKKLQAIAGKDNVDLVEISSQLVDYLKTAGHKVIHSDFLKFGEKGSYDRIVMNPPFSKDQDIDHVMHAYELLKPGGKMTAIMSNMAGLRTNKKNRAFSQWLDDVGAHVEDLEAGAFKSSFNPTSVNTKVVVVEKPTIKAEAKTAKTEQPKPKTPEEIPAGTSLYSTPIIPAFKEVASMMNLNPKSSFAGAVYGGIEGGDRSEAETYSAQWWLDSAFGAAIGAGIGAGGQKLLTGKRVKGKTLFGKNSHGADAYKFVGKQIRRIWGMNKGNQEALDMAKQRDLMKALIEHQAEKAAGYLYKNFTPSQRGIMADLIEGRGIIADGNLLHRQAKELDDFISYTSKKMQELGMLGADIEPGAYLHRYYSKHLGLSGLAKALTPKGKAISGTWSIRRGTQEVFDDKYMSKSMRDTMNQIYSLEAEYKKLEKKSGDLVGTDTKERMAEIKTELKELQSTEFREYLMPENGTLKSFFMAADEVPVIPKMRQTTIGNDKQAKAGLNKPGKQGRFRSMDSTGISGETQGPILTDRRWTIDGMKTKGEGILHRDWTKAERVSWGEIDDAAYRMLRGQAEVAHDLSLGTFYKAINDRFNGTKVSDVPIEGWHKVPETEVAGASRLKKYGALEGKYVSDDIWKVIKNRGQNPLIALFESSDIAKGAVPAVKTYLKFLSKWKTFKTVYNPVSHMNNSIGNLMMYNLSDYEYKYLAQAFKELRKGDFSEWVREAKNNGLFGNDWTSQVTGSTGKRNIDELLEKLRTQPEIADFEQSLDTVMQIKQWFIESSNSVKEAQGAWKTGAEMAKAIGNPLINTAKKPLDKAAKFAQNAYRMEDEFFKLAVYMAERQKGTNPLDSVKSANRYFFDYNDLPDAVKLMRDLPLGSPFISYTAQAVPAIVRTAIEKPEKIFAFVAALEGMNYAAMHLNDELRDEGYWDRMAAKNEIYPSWMKGRSFFGALNNLTVPFTANSYEISLANMLPAGNPMIATSERSEGWPAIFSAYGSGIEGSNPIFKLLYDITNNEDWQGNEIYSKEAPKSEIWRKRINYIYQNITPSNPLFPFSYHQQKILEGASNVVRKSKEEGEEPNRLIGGTVEIANAINDIFSGGQFTGLDRRENEILFKDALFGSIGIKLRPVRIDQLAESKNMELEIKKKGLDKWMSKKEMKFEQEKLSKRQYEKDQEHYKKRADELAEKEDRINEAERILSR